MLSKRIFVLVSLLLVSFLMVGCGTTPPIVDNHPPVITEISDQTVTVGVEYTYDVDAYDPDFDALTYSLIRNPSGMEIDEHTGVITWEYPTVGSHGVTVKVSDGVLYATQPFIVTVIPVAEFTKIEVTPDTMDLVVGDIVTFEVFAHYSFGDPQDITTGCVYTQPTTGVVTVTAGSVTAVKAGTDTILISYTTEGEITVTATIAVTVSGVREPMEITVDLPTFKVGEPYWFTVKMLANDDLGKSVKASFGWPKSTEEVKIAGTLETDVESGVTFALIDDNVFQTETFTMEGTTTVNFRGRFTSPGTFFTTIEVETTDGDLLCGQAITIVVGAVKVGDSYGGGIVAYILQSGDDGYDANVQHGLIAATDDQSIGIHWWNESSKVTGAIGTAIGTGQANTTAIVNVQGDGSYAAQLCNDLTVDDYDDWFLPSIDELNLMYENLYSEGVGGFADSEYWSSSEDGQFKALNQDFSNGEQASDVKTMTCQVRAVRAF